MVTVAALFELETLDGELERQKGVLADIARRTRRDPQLEASEARLATAVTTEARASAELRRLEGDLADIEAKLQRDHGRLYGGSVVDPRELSSLEREIEHYSTQRGTLEERILAVMENVERMQQEIETLTREIAQRREQRETDRPEMLRQSEELKAQISDLEERRASMAADLEPAALRMYDRLRGSSGRAVSRVARGVCEACHVTLPAKDIQHARSGAIVTCTNCARILFTG